MINSFVAFSTLKIYSIFTDRIYLAEEIVSSRNDLLNPSEFLNKEAQVLHDEDTFN